MTDIHAKCAFCAAPVTRKAQAKSLNVQRHFCNIECKAAWQRLAKPVSKEWLEQKYLAEGLDCVQIGRLVDRDAKSVWNWLKDFGIQTRARGGHTSPHAFKKGRKNTFVAHTEETKKRISEMAKASGRVPYDPKVGSYMKGRSGKDTPNWKGGITPERQAFYQSREWKDACIATWARADAKCERCGIHHNTCDARGTFHVHHIVSFMVKELRAEPSNLALLCSKCHRHVHSKANTTKEFIGDAS